MCTLCTSSNGLTHYKQINVYIIQIDPITEIDCTNMCHLLLVLSTTVNLFLLNISSVDPTCLVAKLADLSLSFIGIGRRKGIYIYFITQSKCIYLCVLFTNRGYM